MAIRPLEIETLKAWQQNGQVLMVDAREHKEYLSEHIEGAVSASSPQAHIDELAKAGDTKLVFYCLKGGRSKSACEQLLKQDPSLELYTLEGGIDQWIKKGNKVMSTGKKLFPLDRQVQITVGSLLLISFFCGLYISPSFHIIPFFLGGGLLFAGLTGFCGLARVLTKMPWN